MTSRTTWPVVAEGGSELEAQLRACCERDPSGKAEILALNRAAADAMRRLSLRLRELGHGDAAGEVAKARTRAQAAVQRAVGGEV